MVIQSPLYKKPPIWWLDNVIALRIVSIVTKILNEEITNITSLVEYIIELLEDEYDFDADELNTTNIPEGMKDPLGYEFEQRGGEEPFVYICEDPAFNPDYSPLFLEELLEWVRDINPDTNPVIGTALELLRHGRKIIPLWKWNRTTGILKHVYL